MVGGFLGVEIFFVLSGYLLTSRLLHEHDRDGAVDWVRYAWRRVLRLVPALALFLGGVVVIGSAAARPDAYRLAGDVLWSALGLTNWHLVADGSSYFSSLGRPPLVRHLWSVAIEVQFYAVIPLLVVWLARSRRAVAMAALGAGVAASSVAMALLYRSPDPSRAYFGTDTRIGALLAGVLLAVALRPSDQSDPDDEARPWATVVGGAGLVILVALLVFAPERARWLYPAGFLACRLATALVVAAALRPGWLARAFGSPLPRWLGLRSFGIYLWHWPLVALTRPGIDVTWPGPVRAAVVISGGLVLGHLSFAVAERPFLRGHRRARAPDTVTLPVVVTRWSAATLAVLATLALLMQLPSVDPIAESLRTGAQVVAAQASPAAPPVPATALVNATATSTTTTIGPAVPTPPGVNPAPAPAVNPSPTPVMPPGPAPGTVRVTAIGDSVMISAAGALQARLGPTGFIDAKLSRQFADGIQVSRALREQGRLGEVVVIHLGSNGPPKSRDVDALMAELATVPNARFVTVRIQKPWQDATNQTLRDAAGRYPTVQLIDWFAFSEGHLDWFQSDGTHLKPSGARAYADLVAGAVPAPTPVPTTTPSPPLPSPVVTAPPTTQAPLFPLPGLSPP